MSLDDRLRQAHQNQMDDVRRRVDIEASRASVTAGRSSTPGVFLAAAAAVVILLGGAGLLIRSAVRSAGPTVETEAGTIDDSTVGPIPGLTDLEQEDDKLTDSDQTDTPPAVTVSIPDSSAANGEPTDGEPVDTTLPAGGAAELPDTGTGTDTGTDGPREPSSGVENDVCPSGRRAELESAALRYLGENQGWGRLFDLVDEQDGPHYYQAWEPGYPDPVTVELTLAEPVLATEIRLAQDPFTPVDGDIFVDAAGQQIAITLDGTAGWKRHIFAEPTLLGRFTIRREAMTSNIMEVLVCVSVPG